MRDKQTYTPRLRWGVWCHVSGGVTSSRADWLKKQGERAVYATKEEAAAEAARIQANISPYSRAMFHYSARPL